MTGASWPLGPAAKTAPKAQDGCLFWDRPVEARHVWLMARQWGVFEVRHLMLEPLEAPAARSRPLAALPVRRRALQQGRLYREAVLGQEQLQARAAGRALGQSCCERRNGWSNPAPTAGLKLQSCAQHQARARPAPGPTRPAPGPHQARTRPAPPTAEYRYSLAPASPAKPWR